jgi:hypothetical protein
MGHCDVVKLLLERFKSCLASVFIRTYKSEVKNIKAFFSFIASSKSRRTTKSALCPTLHYPLMLLFNTCHVSWNLSTCFSASRVTTPFITARIEATVLFGAPPWGAPRNPCANFRIYINLADKIPPSRVKLFRVSLQ